MFSKNNKSKIVTDEEIKNKKIFEKCGFKIKREINDNIIELDDEIDDNFVDNKNMDIDDENKSKENENKKEEEDSIIDINNM